ncbi:MAG TPA: XdhC/CoxI family protein [Desulfobacterales bacterium]|nr:XdhC/CoxI family protein [Desulfobacterales bacterium]
MNSIPETAVRLLDEGRAFVLATIVSRHGSTPRTAGTRMIVTADGSIRGTIGGGLVEAKVIEAAGGVLRSKRPVVMPFDLTRSEVAAMDMICGGRLEVLLECVQPGGPAEGVLRGWGDAIGRREASQVVTLIRFAGAAVADTDHLLIQERRVVVGGRSLPDEVLERILDAGEGGAGLRTVALGGDLAVVEAVLPGEIVYLFGAGHVAHPASRLAAFVGFRVVVVDDRPEFANRERFPDAEEVRVVPDFGVALNGCRRDPEAFVVILTRGHLHDKSVLAQALRTDAGYIGMIGSRRKRDQIFAALRQEGFTEADLQRVASPIGLPIGAETPEEIAISIVAELIQVRARRRRP